MWRLPWTSNEAQVACSYASVGALPDPLIERANVSTKYILGALALLFVGAALLRLSKEAWRLTPASRTWLTVGGIFAAVSTWLWLQR